MSKRDSGRLGGLAVLAKYGIAHMRAIGSRGGRAMWRKYHLRPYGTASFQLIRRDSGEVVRVINPPVTWR